MASPEHPGEGTRLFVKCDDLTSAIYGGNKVRKLEYVLARARQRKKTRLLTMGAVGSHHVLATAIFGRAHGFRVHAILVGQPWTRHAERNLRAGLSVGLTAEAAWEGSLHLRLLAAMDADTEVIALGGSSVQGSLGYVDAAIELAGQVARGELPEPDEIVVAMGSGGTVAGLLVGLAKTRLRTRVVGVSIAKPVFVVRELTRRLTRHLAHACKVPPGEALARLVVDGHSVGRGYGHATSAGELARELATASGIKVDPTYTAKALASALGRAESTPSAKIVFWNTLSSATLEHAAPGLEREPLPEELRALLRDRPKD
jgi:1-aminocyclopropane-1-carboxylate deaminase/D-cysteine desulfhydrase-like pyridoxal-dependent ACC family enzyme